MLQSVHDTGGAGRNSLAHDRGVLPAIERPAAAGTWIETFSRVALSEIASQLCDASRSWITAMIAQGTREVVFAETA